MKRKTLPSLRSTDVLEAMHTLKRAAYYLADYSDVMQGCICGDDGDLDKETIKARDESKALADRLLELCGEFEAKQEFDRPAQAAQIIAAMLGDWKLPGAVWYAPRIKRFRLTGEDYKPTPKEILCGVYLPGASVSELADDFDVVMASNV